MSARPFACLVLALAGFCVQLAVIVLSQCGNDECADIKNTFGAASTEYQQCRSYHSSGSSHGGSYGGYSSGGSHK